MKQGYCLICFNPLLDSLSLKKLFTINNMICNKCLQKFKIINKKEIVNGIETRFLYEYNSFLKELIYKYKGCYDLNLAPSFLYMFKNKIKKEYKDYIIVYPPSNENEIKSRGYDHIKEIVKCLNMKALNIFYKKKEYKQSSFHYNERYKIKDIIKIKENIKLDKNKKYLIIDDIYTSGNTLKTIINLLISKNINKNNIKALIISKTII